MANARCIRMVHRLAFVPAASRGLYRVENHGRSEAIGRSLRDCFGESARLPDDMAACIRRLDAHPYARR